MDKKKRIFHCQECGLKVLSPIPEEELGQVETRCPKCGKRILTSHSTASGRGGHDSVRSTSSVRGKAGPSSAVGKKTSKNKGGVAPKKKSTDARPTASPARGSKTGSSKMPKKIILVDPKVIKHTGPRTGTAIPASHSQPKKKKNEVERRCEGCGIRLVSPASAGELKYADARCPRCGKKIVL